MTVETFAGEPIDPRTAIATLRDRVAELERERNEWRVSAVESSSLAEQQVRRAEKAEDALRALQASDKALRAALTRIATASRRDKSLPQPKNLAPLTSLLDFIVEQCDAALAQPAESGGMEKESDPLQSPDHDVRTEALAAQLWNDLVEKTDRTSPAEYPDMALITQEEFFDYLCAVGKSATHPNSAASEGDEEAAKRIAATHIARAIREAKP